MLSAIPIIFDHLVRKQNFIFLCISLKKPFLITCSGPEKATIVILPQQTPFTATGTILNELKYKVLRGYIKVVGSGVSACKKIG